MLHKLFNYIKYIVIPLISNIDNSNNDNNSYYSARMTKLIASLDSNYLHEKSPISRTLPKIGNGFGPFNFNANITHRIHDFK